MRVQFQLIDVDYIQVDSKPTVRLFGKTEDNKSITVFYDKFLPYFYILPVEGKENILKELIEKKFSDSVVQLETLEKFLPIGYQEKPSKVLKVTLNNPGKIPFVRDGLRNERSVKEVFEADILFKYRFMADFDISGMKWYEVEGERADTNTVKTNIKIHAKSFKELEKEDNIQFKYMSIDIETLSEEGGMPNPERNQIILISMSFYPSFRNKNTLVLAAKNIRKIEKDVMGFSSEKEMLREFVRIIDSYDPDVILGYNSTNFDLPYIEARLKKNNISRAIGRCRQKPMFLRKFGNRYRASITGRITVDVYSLIKEATTKFGLFKGLKRYGLGDVSRLILDEDKIDISHSEINSHWIDNGEKLQKLITYSCKDAELPLKILLKQRMLDKFLEISKVSGILPQDAIDGGEVTRIENLLLKEFNKRNFIILCRPTSGDIVKRHEDRRKNGLKGAFVLKPDIGFHDKCVVYLDFQSMYPSIIINFNICPTTLCLKKMEPSLCLKTPFGSNFISPKIKRGIIPEIVDHLLKTREKIRKEMRSAKTKEKKNYLYAKQYAFKTIANAFYGYSGYIRAKLYVLDIANSITSTGRYSIKKTKEIVEKQTPYKVIYADTDSVFIKLQTNDVPEAFKISDELTKIINENIEYGLKMKIESVFKTLLILTKKRYAGWSFERIDGTYTDTIITKGIETVRRDWCKIVSETLERVLDTILKEQDVDKAVKLVKNTVNDIKMGKMNIDKLVITKSISRPIKTYKGIQPHVELVKRMRKRDPASAPSVGDRVGFVIVKGPQLISQRAEDPEYIKKNKLSIDSKYYIESQLLPPLERVFEALNINKSDLMGIGRQLGLFEAIRVNAIKESQFEPFLSELDGFICNSCNNIFRRIPLSGKCNSCSGEIVFFKEDKKSRVYNPWIPQQTANLP